jgi:hypothetical protein
MVTVLAPMPSDQDRQIAVTVTTSLLIAVNVCATVGTVVDWVVPSRKSTRYCWMQEPVAASRSP